MLSNILRWFGFVKDGSIQILSPSHSATVSGVVTVSGTSIQQVNGSALPAQSFSFSLDTSLIANGPFTISATNSAGHTDDCPVIVNNTSPNNSIIYNGEGNTLVDSAGAKWTLSAGVVYKNGATIGFSSGISELIFHNGTFVSHYPGPPSSEWLWDGSFWVQSTWPVPVTDAAHLPFWGANGHITWGGTAYSLDSAMAARLVSFGANVFRNGYTFGDLNRFKNFISAYAAPAHIAVYPVLLYSHTADESSGYAVGYSIGVEVAGLKGYVPMYEIANEYDGYAISGGDGDVPSNYDDARYKISRGLIRGVVDGIRSIDQTTKIAGPGGTWLHYGFSGMLWNGTSPSSSGSADASKIVRWDITTWHWYDNMGNIESAGSGSKNALSALAAYGVPLRMNEWGCYASSFSDEAAIATYLTGANLMQKWDTKRSAYGIVGADIYELFDDGMAGDEGQFGVVASDATTPKGRWSAVAAYIAAHP